MIENSGIFSIKTKSKIILNTYKKVSTPTLLEFSYRLEHESLFHGKKDLKSTNLDVLLDDKTPSNIVLKTIKCKRKSRL